MWHEFLAKKFSQTELEKLRKEFEQLPDTGEQGALTREEFDKALKSLKNGKAVGADGIPAEVWKNSKVASEALFEFLCEVWNKEEVPLNLIVCVFVMIIQKQRIAKRLLKIPCNWIAQSCIQSYEHNFATQTG